MAASITARALGSLVMLAVANLVVGCMQSVTTGLIKDIANGLHTGAADVGFGQSVYSLSVVVSALPMFVLLRARSRRSVIVIALAFGCAGCVLGGVAPNFGWFAVSRAIGGIGHGLWSMAAMAYTVHVVDWRYLGRAIALVSAGGALAMWLGLPVMTWIGSTSGGWRLAFVVLGIAAFGIGSWMMVALPRDSIAQHRDTETNQRETPGRKTRQIGRGVVLPVALANAPTLATAAAFYVFFSYVSVWLLDVAGAPRSQVAVLLFASGTGSLIGLAVIGPIADRIGAQRAQDLTQFALIAASVMLLAVVLLGGNQAMRGTGMFLLGVPGGALGSVIQTRAVRLTPPGLQHETTVGQAIAGNGGVALGGVLGGLIVAVDRVSLLPWAATSLAVTAFAIDRVVAVRLAVNHRVG